MQSQMDQERLKQGLMDDLSQAQSVATKSAQARGTSVAVPPGEKESFEPKALRYKNKVIGQAELDENKKAADDLIEHLISTANFSDQLEASRKKVMLRRSMNDLRLKVIRQSAALGQMMNNAQLDQAQSQATTAAWANAISGAVSGGMIATKGFGMWDTSAPTPDITKGVTPSYTTGGTGSALTNETGFIPSTTNQRA